MYICLYEDTETDNIGKVYYYNEKKFAQQHEIEKGIVVNSIPENNLQEVIGKTPTLFINKIDNSCYWELAGIPSILTPEQESIQELENELLLLTDASEGGIL